MKDLPKLEFEPTLTDRSDFSKEEEEAILKDSGMTENGLNRMSQDIFETTDYNDSFSVLGERAEEVKAELNDLYDSIKNGQEPTEEQTKKIQELREEYEDLGASAKDIATYNLQMNKGVEKLVKN